MPNPRHAATSCSVKPRERAQLKIQYSAILPSAALRPQLLTCSFPNPLRASLVRHRSVFAGTIYRGCIRGCTGISARPPDVLLVPRAGRHLVSGHHPQVRADMPVWTMHRIVSFINAGVYEARIRPFEKVRPRRMLTEHSRNTPLTTEQRILLESALPGVRASTIPRTDDTAAVSAKAWLGVPVLWILIAERGISMSYRM